MRNYVLLSAVIVGLMWRDLAALLRPFLFELLVINLGLAIFRLSMMKPATIQLGAKTPVLIYQTAWLSVALPAIGVLCVSQIRLPAEYHLAVLAFLVAPPMTSTTTLAILFKLNPSPVLIGFLTASGLSPIVVFVTFNTVSLSGDVPSTALALRLFWMIGSAGILGLLLWKTVHPAIAARHHIACDFVALGVVVLICIAVMDDVLDLLISAPANAAVVITGVLSLSALVASLSFLCFWSFGRAARDATILNSTLPNVGAMLAVLDSQADTNMKLMVAGCQIMVALLPIILSLQNSDD